MGLEEAPIDAQQDPDAGGHQDEHHAPAVGQPELVGDPPLEGQDQDELDPDGHQADAVHPGDPPAHQVPLSRRLQAGDPAHDTDEDGRAGHGQDEEQAEQLGDLAVGLRGHQSGDGHDDECSRTVDQHAGDRHRAGLEQSALHRVVGAHQTGCRFVVR